MTASIDAPRRVATLVGGFDRSPAYAGLADALTLLIGDGRIGLGTRLPSERELTEALGVSRTTVTRAYAALRDARVRRGPPGRRAPTPGCPGGRGPRPRPRAAPPPGRPATRIDLNCAAAVRARRASRRRTPRPRPSCRPTSAATATSPPGCRELQARHRRAVRRARAAHRPGPDHGRPPGALARRSIVAQALAGRGDRVLVESPGLPQRHRGDPPRRRPAGRLPGRPRRLGPRRGRPPRCARPRRGWPT